MLQLRASGVLPKVPQVTCLTFGSPRVGDQAFAAAFDDQVDCYRFINKRDVVCALPPMIW